ncbi:hypothetical protein AK812_SmicGene41338 [Symbiodinium microadriaticum]|uniref:Uncharacterized protein n=1 Tax=Symbiodinium microadriaticum TaxID=2951 RepID=A0A1Q9C6D5_SYMMI|nr:hypothetical protein AK812_SmicGene41338 [Symbiodinium microadriaticum]
MLWQPSHANEENNRSPTAVWYFLIEFAADYVNNASIFHDGECQSAEATPLMETVLPWADADALRALAGDMRWVPSDLVKRLMDRSSCVAWAAAFQMAGKSKATDGQARVRLVAKRVAIAQVEDAVDKVLIATLCFLLYLPSIPFELAVGRGLHTSCPPDQVYVFDAIFFGQLGAPWGRWDSLSTWWSDFWKYDLKDVLHEHALAQAASEFRENRVAAAGAAEADIQFSFSRGCLVPVRCEV